jgi:hypothetical protein
MDQNITHSSSHEEQTLQSDVPGVDGKQSYEYPQTDADD